MCRIGQDTMVLYFIIIFGIYVIYGDFFLGREDIY